jgi:hypothetical protein
MRLQGADLGLSTASQRAPAFGMTTTCRAGDARLSAIISALDTKHENNDLSAVARHWLRCTDSIRPGNPA